MTTTLALVRAELTLLRRDTTAWATAIALPFVLGGAWALSPPPFAEGVGEVIVLQVMLLLVFTLHTVGTMTLASRREQLLLKRWRSSQASRTGVLVGSIGLLGILVMLQAAVLTVITAALAGQAPASVPVLLLGALAGVAVVGALTFLAAVFTRSPEHAMITTLPVMVVLTAATIRGLTRPPEALDWPLLALPGGGVTQVLRLGWSGVEGGGLVAWVAQAAPGLAATAVLTALAAAVAVRTFRWEPRQ